MFSQSNLQLFLDIASTYQSQSLKTYTIAFRDKLLTKINNALLIAKQITNDVKKEILNDEFLSKKELDFLFLVALENKDREGCEQLLDFLIDG